MNRPGSQRGLTLLEVIVSTAMLAGLAAMILGAVSFLETASLRHKHRLNASEVAHRVITQYLDNATLLPDASLPIQHGDSLYRYLLREEAILTEEGEAEGLRRGTGRNVTQIDTMQQLTSLMGRVTVQVYLDTPGVPIDTSGPLVELSRIYSVITLNDEDEALRRLLEFADRIQAEQFSGQRTNQPPAGNQGGQGGQRR